MQFNVNEGNYCFTFEDEKDFYPYVDRITRILEEAKRTKKAKQDYRKKTEELLKAFNEGKGKKLKDFTITLDQDAFYGFMEVMLFGLLTSTQGINNEGMYRAYLAATLREKKLSETVDAYLSEVNLTGNYETGFHEFEQQILSFSQKENEEGTI